MTYRKLRNSAQSLKVGTTEGRYMRLRPDTELTNSGDPHGQALTQENRAPLNVFMFGGLHEDPTKTNAFGELA